jgi:Silencing defective 2 N-terminal ubiquitin domain
MSLQTVNVLLSSFPGLSLPPTLSIPFPPTSTIADLIHKIATYLPPSLNPSSFPLILTTTNNKQLLSSSSDPLLSLLATNNGASTATSSIILPLRLTVPLRGGKGGFGSQLRAAGGRMSSKRKRNQEENNGSNRNLDGRRLRTISEAKALAEYLAVKPEMDRKEKEERRRRWEAVVESAERRQEALRTAGGKNRLDGQWMEDKNEMSEKARDAVLKAMKDGEWRDHLRDTAMGGSSASASASEGGSSDTSPDSSEKSDDENSHSQPAFNSIAPRRYIGFDDDDEFMSEDNSDSDDVAATEAESHGHDQVAAKGKGKERV